MPQAVELDKVQSGINVTPLVDVVLVLLIIFMIVAPQLQSDAAVTLPKTERPPDNPDDGRQIVLIVESTGAMRIENQAVTAEELPLRMQQAAEGREDWKVVIKGDARLTFGQVQSAMLAVDNAGFADVGLIAERHED